MSESNYLEYTPQMWIENKEKCEAYFANENEWNLVPLLNVNYLHDLQDKRLVRFYGMIQDMHDPEYYLHKYEIINEETKETYVKCGAYCDTTNLSGNETINYDSTNNTTLERHSVIMVSYPGLNEWVYNIEKERHKIKPLLIEEPSTSHKRRIDEDDLMEISYVPQETKESEPKKICVESKSEALSIVSDQHILNLPLPDQNGKCCIVKVYEKTDDLKLNSMLEILGFLSVDPLLNERSKLVEGDNAMEVQTHHPPPSLVPRIHCVLFKKIIHNNPLMKTISLQHEQILNLNKDLNILFTQLLFGDKLAADYLICHLLSNIYCRKDFMALGKFTLNLSNIPVEKIPECGEILYSFIELLMPKSHYFAMTLDNMNDLAFHPKKDYECNRLTSGILQLSDNTHFVIDETKLQPGQLNSSGCKGLAALASVIKNQKLQYDFHYFQIEHDCDIPMLILSEGTSLLPSDFHVPLVLDEKSLNTFPEIITAAKYFLNPDLLNNLRIYLTQMRHSSFDIPSAILEVIEKDFVRLRQNNSITTGDFHQLLVLARLVSLSKGKLLLDEESWTFACYMEIERKARLQNLPTRK